MDSVPDINLKKICYSILKDGYFIQFTRKKPQQHAILQVFALALIEHDLTTISSCSHLC